MSLEWKSCKIGDVVSVRRGSSPRPIKDYVSETGMPWVKIADATKDQTRFINFTSEFIKEEGIETIKHLIFPVNKVDGLDIGKIFKIVRFPETAKEN